MITIRNERSTDIPARERLLDAAFGPGRLAKASERLREDRFAADELLTRHQVTEDFLTAEALGSQIARLRNLVDQ